ncbi:hypothetical protein L2E82_48500 [Cichorium intybus]|uniref:Uncharacterized protein n=1 Tax=Cichorium intybus TaxID=13427 RepID=A0ACB8YYG4_CICIN|nr:hypothetical protein L2E82_48500 [Cichorium intybus]
MEDRRMAFFWVLWLVQVRKKKDEDIQMGDMNRNRHGHVTPIYREDQIPQRRGKVYELGMSSEVNKEEPRSLALTPK